MSEPADDPAADVDRRRVAPEHPIWSPSTTEYGALRRMAAAWMRRERAGHTLDPTALVHEVLLRIGGGTGDEQRKRLALALAAMRNILVDYARRRGAEKRGGGRRRVELDDRVELTGRSSVDATALLEAVAKMEQSHPRQAEVVQMRFFAELSVDEVAERLGVSARTVKNDWSFAQAWLRRELGREDSA